MNKTEKKALIGASLLIVVPMLTISLYRTFFLRKSLFTYAVYQGHKVTGKTWEDIITFKTNEGEKINAELFGDYGSILEIGDTIWIKYSRDDPSIVEVVDIDYSKYMKKKK